MVIFLVFSFFFSSRRRHTRSLRDWSSDVCSSDLSASSMNSSKLPKSPYARDCTSAENITHYARIVKEKATLRRLINAAAERSEERRVGKECRSRGTPYH